MVAHSFPQNRRLLVGGNRKVSVSRVLSRRLGHLETLCVFNASLAQFHPSKNGDHSEEDDDSHKTTDNQTFPTCDKRIELTTRRTTLIIERQPVWCDFQRSDFSAAGGNGFGEQRMMIERMMEDLVWTVLLDDCGFE